MAGNVAPSLHHGHRVDAPVRLRVAVTNERERPMRDQRAEVSLNIAPNEAFESAPVEPRSFRILVMGDFSARGDGGPLASELPRRVDRDDLDAHVARIAPRLRVSIDDRSVDLAFAAMDDFHPDRLVARLTALGQRPESTTTEALPSAPSRPTSAGATPDIVRAVSGASLLDDMLDDVTPGAPSAASATRPKRSDELSAFVERAVAPHLVRPPDAETAARAAASDRDLTRTLRLVLHHPRVQALEATWRSLELLVRRLDTDGDLDLFMLDVARDQVASTLERLAQRRDAAGDETWALAVSLHGHPDGDDGADALARIALAARAFETPVVAAAPPILAGRANAASLDDDDDAPLPTPEVFTLIRRSLEARFLGLTFPRVLLRPPYGSENPCDTLDFEEIEDPERHEDYLWGSGSSLVALLVGEAFNERGWSIGPRMLLDVGSLPLFTYRRGPETVATPCAEIVMSERIARHLLSRGLMPLAWIKNTDRVRLVELRSVADPAAPLAAAWTGATSGSAS
jgi:type VI secretion system protein ImpC